ncbi:hypothetical protein BX661DRAFT_224382 [Kickxella alabastrina]|uniref:uncharacterized protein n=1 Tax=Kickxella alabastrina TaxID=61397 RepID=UPI00221F1377|nr:uncharacterized protein BX661DRAFT_224382 [Kickxella alabastrina]KAI7828405.1 hypothetical protein BX661DRAFT_224382 [Kickxella alabastrina]
MSSSIHSHVNGHQPATRLPSIYPMMRSSKNVHDPVYPTYSPYLTTESQIQSLKSMLAQGDAENKEIHARIDKAEAHIEKMLAEDNGKDAEISALENENRENEWLQSENDRLRSERNRLWTENKELQRNDAIPQKTHKALYSLVLSKHAEIEQLHADAKRKRPYTDALHDATEHVQSSKKRTSDKIADITAQLADAQEDLAALADDKRRLKEETFSLTKQLTQANNSLACKDAHIASLKAQACTETGSNGGARTRHATSGAQVNGCPTAPDSRGNCNHQNEIVRLNSKLTKADCAQEHSACQLEKMKRCLEIKEREIMALIGNLADQPFESRPMDGCLGPKQSVKGTYLEFLIDTPNTSMESPADNPVRASELKQRLRYVAVADALVQNRPSNDHTTPRTRAEDYPADGSSNVSTSRPNCKSNSKSVRFALD